MNQLFLFDSKKQQPEVRWDFGGGGWGGGSSTEVPTYMYHKNLGGGQDIFKSKYYFGGTKKMGFFGGVKSLINKLLGTMTGCKLNSLMLKLPWGLFTYSVTTATRVNNTKLTNRITER